MIKNTLIRFGVSLHSSTHFYNRERNLLIHHGLLGSSKDFTALAMSLHFSNYVNSYVIDARNARNHGDSPHTQTHAISDLAEDVYQYLTEHGLLTSSKKWTLLGHSMGGMALMEFTKRYDRPEIQAAIDRIIIVDIPTTPIIQASVSYKKTGQMLREMFGINLSQSLPSIYEQIQKKAVNTDSARRLKSYIKQGIAGYKWKCNMQLLATHGYQEIGNFDLATDNPGRWIKPVEIIYGELSPYFNEQQFRLFKKFYRALRPEDCHKVQQAAHWVHTDNPQKFAEVMEVILKKDQKMCDR